MQQPTDYQPTDDDVKHIWSETYVLFTKYKDIDCLDKEDEIMNECYSILDRYHNCKIVQQLISGVIRVLLDRSSTYRLLVNDKG